MDRHLDEELEKLNTQLLKMATMTEEAIHSSIEALKNSDLKLAERVISNDKEIDEMELQNEELIIDILALFQPFASDLRFITTGMHINNELERIADLTVNIAHRVIELSVETKIDEINEIPELADQAKKMLKNSIDAFVNRNEELAKEVILSDNESNELRNTIVTKLIYDDMVVDSKTVPSAIPLLLVSRDLERICDHTASIAEDVIYMINAKVVRHHRELLEDSNSSSKSRL